MTIAGYADFTKARRMIAAIDKRIDMVRAQHGRLPADATAHDYQRAWDRIPGLQGIERNLFRHRGDWQVVRDEWLAKRAATDERAANRRLIAKARKMNCPSCGGTGLAA